MSNRFTEEEISNLHLLGRLLGQSRRFATSPLNKAGKNHLFKMLDAGHNLPAALLNPQHYDIADDMEHLRELLDGMNNPCFLQKEDNAVENKAWTIPELKAIYSHSIRNEESIRKSNLCGCFHCISILAATDIKEMMVEKAGLRTAICPICGIDSVLGDASVEITAELLEALNEYYF
jgi:hypothetical protein